MLKDLLNEVIVLVAGKPAEPIADLLNSAKHVNEFLIAKKLDITINQARNILYKISNYGLVSSIRKKDKKKGWFTYFWKIEVVKSLEFLRESLIKRMDQINNQIKSREAKQFYVCEKCNIELSEENALFYDFTCQECGKVFSLKDNSGLLKELKKQQARLIAKIEEIDKEIESERVKEEKLKPKKKLVLDKKSAARRFVKKKILKNAPEKKVKKIFHKSKKVSDKKAKNILKKTKSKKKR
ncbi:MAG: hypothetical protein AABW50_04135 [Nanoarchaeota archaeon]